MQDNGIVTDAIDLFEDSVVNCLEEQLEFLNNRGKDRLIDYGLHDPVLAPIKIYMSGKNASEDESNDFLLEYKVLYDSSFAENDFEGEFSVTGNTTLNGSSYMLEYGVRSDTIDFKFWNDMCNRIQEQFENRGQLQTPLVLTTQNGLDITGWYDTQIRAAAD